MWNEEISVAPTEWGKKLAERHLGRGDREKMEAIFLTRSQDWGPNLSHSTSSWVNFFALVLYADIHYHGRIHRLLYPSETPISTFTQNVNSEDNNQQSPFTTVFFSLLSALNHIGLFTRVSLQNRIIFHSVYILQCLSYISVEWSLVRQIRAVILCLSWDPEFHREMWKDFFGKDKILHEKHVSILSLKTPHYRDKSTLGWTYANNFECRAI